MNLQIRSQYLSYFEALFSTTPSVKPRQLIHAFECEEENWANRECACDRLGLFVDGGETAHYRNLALSRDSLDYLNERLIQFITIRMISQGKLRYSMATEHGWQLLMKEYNIRDIGTLEDVTQEINNVYCLCDDNLVLNTEQTTYVNIIIDLWITRKNGPCYLCIFASFVPQLMIGRNSGEFYTAWLNDASKASNMHLLAFVPLAMPTCMSNKVNIFHETMERYRLEKNVMSFVMSELDIQLSESDLSPYRCPELQPSAYLTGANHVINALTFVISRHALVEPLLSDIFARSVSLPDVTIQFRTSRPVYFSEGQEMEVHTDGWRCYSFHDLRYFLELEEGYSAWLDWRFDRNCFLHGDPSHNAIADCNDEEKMMYNYFLAIMTPFKSVYEKIDDNIEGELLVNFIMYDSLNTYFSALKSVWKGIRVETMDGIDYSFLNPPAGLDIRRCHAVLRCALSTEEIFLYYYDCFYANPLPWVALTLDPTKKLSYINRMFPEKANIYSKKAMVYLDHYLNHEDVQQSALSFAMESEVQSYLEKPCLYAPLKRNDVSIVKYWFDRKEMWPEISVLAVAFLYSEWMTTKALDEITNIAKALWKANGQRLQFPTFERLVKIRQNMIKFGFCEGFKENRID